MKNKLASIIIAVSVVTVFGILYGSGKLSLRTAVPSNNLAVNKQPASEPVAANKPIIPSGDQIFSVAQAANIYPKFIQVEVNPSDARPGDVQKLRAVIEDPYPIKSVHAETQLDTKNISVPLTLSGPASASDVLPQKYAVDGNDQLVILDKAVNPIATVPVGVALAASGQPETYVGEWTVENTHVTTYRTKFIAEDTNGNINFVTLAWTDSCAGINQGVDSTISSNCTVSGTDGLDGGNLTVTNATISIGSSGNFYFNPGKSITMGASGVMTIANGGYFAKAYLYYTDADGDTYAPNTTISTSSASTVAAKVRLSLASAGTDCLDSSAQAYPGAGYQTVSNAGLAEGGWDYDCSNSGSATEQYTIVNGACITCVLNGSNCAVSTAGADGWEQSTAPACGATGNYVSNYGNCGPLSCQNGPSCIEAIGQGQGCK
ncbi:MAG: hypothetical protein KGJ89_04945 [Patescibacteria group bacterium]|nr:hypothetical protein [Patescibacteria group bacterium]MDE2015536.1 hypothetical protein [Patescibacteria group bacterium]MDE2227268.1 hypothetical protein [Patescibacteria group bacterium]